MDSKDYDLVNEEIKLVISELNNKEILSGQDKIEIEDHFYCDVEELANVGLSTKEALLVARSRFGALEGIREDYEAVKPESNLMYFGFMGVLMFSCLKGLFVLTNIMAQLYWISAITYDSSFLENHFWVDIPFRFLLLIGGVWMIFKHLKRNNIATFSRFWYIPLLYLSMEVLDRLIGFVVLPGMNPYTPSYNMQFYGVMIHNQAIVNLVTIVLVGVVVSFLLFRMKKSEYEFV